MIGYILMGLGAYLIYDDYREAKVKKLLKEGGPNETILENGISGSSGNRNRKPGAASEKTDRERSVIGIPIKEKGDNADELFEGSIQHDKSDTPGDRTGDDSSGKPVAASSGNQTKGVEDIRGDEENAGDQSDIENGTGDDGDDVRS